MTRRQTKRPTRRKPSRPTEHGKYSTVPDYSAPWTIWVGGFAIAILPLLSITLAAYGHVHGWW